MRVYLGEVAAAEETAMSGERGRMRCSQDEMLTSIDHLSFASSGRTPEDEDEAGVMTVQLVDDSIGQLFPALTAV